jgi:hypothetical protein
MLTRIIHRLLKAHEAQPPALHSVLGEVPDLDPPDRLPLHQRAAELDDREDEPAQITPHGFRLRIDP